MSFNLAPPSESKHHGPLSFMHQVTHGVYLYRPESTRPITSDAPEPTLVLLFGWVAAQDGPLAKYVEGYRKIYPETAILLLKSDVTDMVSSSAAKQKVGSSIAAIRAIVGTRTGEEQQSECKLLIHSFSNGGSRLLSALYKEYEVDALKRQLGADESVLPRHVTIIDSAPTTHFDRSTAVASVAQSLPRGLGRTLLTPVLHVVSFVLLLYVHLPGTQDAMAVWAASHNDKTKVHEIRRTYIYSDIDPIIKRVWVEWHADAAENKGFTVRREMFPGSPHVSHARTDPERYWKVVQETWTG